MAAPPQLQRAHRPRRSSPRQLVERVRERLDIKELLFLKAFPNQRLEQGNRNRIEGFRFPWCRRLVVSLYNIEVHHFNGRVEVVGVKLYDMPHGDPWRRARWLVCPDCGKTRSIFTEERDWGQITVLAAAVMTSDTGRSNPPKNSDG